MGTKRHLRDIISGYDAEGLSTDQIYDRLRREHPEYFGRKHYDSTGPITFEGAVSLNIRKHGMSPDRAIRAAASAYPRLQHDYYERLQVGAAANMDYILGGGCLI